MHKSYGPKSVVVLGLLLCSLSGSRCYLGTPPASQPPSPPPPTPSTTFSMWDVVQYTAQPGCVSTPEFFPARLNALQGAMNNHQQGSFGNVFGNFSASAWVDRDLAPWGEDHLMADATQFVAFKGHAWLDLGFWATSRLAFPIAQNQPVGFDRCGPRLVSGSPTSSFAGNTQLGFGTVGGGKTGTVLLFSSCSGAPRKIIGTAWQNRASQYMGFAYSPDGVNLPEGALPKFYEDSQLFGNAWSWENSFGEYRTSDFLNAGASTYGVHGSDYDLAKAINVPSGTGVTLAHSLFHGVGTGTKYGRNQSSLVKVHGVMTAACRFDVSPPDPITGTTNPRCAHPLLDVAEDGSLSTTCDGYQSSSVLLPLTGSPQRTIASATTATNVGTPFVTFKKKPMPVSTFDVARAASGLARYMTGVVIDPRVVEPGVILNSTQGEFPSLRSVSDGDGIAVSFDSVNQRLVVFDGLIPDVMGSDGQPTIVEPEVVATIVEELADSLPRLGLPDRTHWSFDKPLVNETFEIFAELDGNGNVAHSLSRLLTHKIKVFRLVNGTPWLESWLSVWVHRSGQIMKLEVTAMGADLQGEPGAEVSELPPVLRGFDFKSGRSAFENWMTARGFNTQNIARTDAVVYSFDSSAEIVRPFHYSAMELERNEAFGVLQAGTRLLRIALDDGSKTVRVVGQPDE